MADITGQPEPVVSTLTETSCYATARAQARQRLHPRLTHRAGWADHDGPLPVIEASIIGLAVDRLPADRNPTPLWL